MESPAAPADPGPQAGARCFEGYYALVAYIPGSLGEFLDRLRRELVPGCKLRSHVSVLPPRPSRSTDGAGAGQLLNDVKRLRPVVVRAGAVLTFPKTDVVYLEITSGSEELLSMHGRLNVGDLAFQEEYAYHPHITLAQNFNPSQLHAIQEIASSRWREFDGERGFLLDRLTFVRYEGSNGWVDIAECRLARIAT